MATRIASCSGIYQTLVRNVEREDDIIISFIFNSKLHKLCRPKSQILEKTLQRVRFTLAKSDKRRGKKPTLSPSPSLVITLLDESGSQCLPTDITNERAWCDGTWFVIGEQRYQVLVNHPRVRKLQVPEFVMVGCPIVPQV